MFEWLFGSSICKLQGSLSKLNFLGLLKKGISARGEIRIIDTCICPSGQIFTSNITHIRDCNKYMSTCKNVIELALSLGRVDMASLVLIKECSHGTEVTSVIGAKHEVVTNTSLLQLETELLYDFEMEQDTIIVCGLAPKLDRIVQLPTLVVKENIHDLKTLFTSFVFTETVIKDSKGTPLFRDHPESLLLTSYSGAFKKVDFWEVALEHCHKNALFITAAGNDNENFNNLSTKDIKQHNSACLPPPESCKYDITICVGTYIYTDNGKRQVAGNYGNNYIDIVADTTQIYTAGPGGFTGYHSGETSFAAPQITAALAYMKTCAPEASAQELKNALVDSRIA